MTSQRAEAGELERTRLFAKMSAQLFTFETEPDEDSAALNALSGLCLPPNLRTATDTWRRGARCSTSGGASLGTAPSATPGASLCSGGARSLRASGAAAPCAASW